VELEEIFNETEMKLIQKVAEYLHINNKIAEASPKYVIRFAVLDILVPLVLKNMEVKYGRRT